MAAFGTSRGDGGGHASCGVCLQQCRDPRLLPCLHSLCRGCIDQLSVTGENGTIVCPLCRTVCKLPENGAAGLPKDFTAGDADGPPTVVSCDMCKEAPQSLNSNAATTWCENCHVALCDEHALPHLKTTVEGHHSISLLGKLKSKHKSQSKGIAFELAVPLCAKHGQALRLHCGSCDVSICGECTAVGDHQGHKPIQYVKDVVEQRKAKVAKQVNELEHNTVVRLERSLQAVDKVCSELEQRAEEVSADIQEAGKRAVAAVEEHVCRMLQEVDDTKEGRLKVLREQRDGLRRHLEASQNAILFSKRLMKQKGGGEAFFSLLHALETRTAGLISSEIPEQPQRHSHIIFQSAGNSCVLSKARESIGSVIPCQASAQQSVIEGPLSRSVIRGSGVKFTLQARNENGKEVTVGGDVILARSVQQSDDTTSLDPEVIVEDHGNGTYTVLCTPAGIGTYKVEILVNGECMKSRLSITCHEKWVWDRGECHSQITISDDQRKASILHSGGHAHLSVLGSMLMCEGEHTWKIKIGPSLGHHMLGVASKPLSSIRQRDYGSAAYCWYSHGGPFYRDGVQCDKSRISWSGNDTFQLCLNCDQHTLQITNIRTGERSTLSNMPVKEYFQFADMYTSGNSVEFID